MLTSAEVGKLALLYAGSSIFGTVTILSLNVATAKFVAESDGDRKSMKIATAMRSAVMLVGLSTVSGLIFILALSPAISLWLFGSEFDASIISAAIASAAISNFAGIFASVLWGLSLFGELFVLNVAGAVIGQLCAVFLAWFGFRLAGVVIGWNLGWLVALVIAAVYCRPHLRQNVRDPLQMKSMILYSYPILLSSLIGIVQNWSDVTVLFAVTRNLVYTGVYYLSLTGANMFSIFTAAMASAIFPTLSNKHGRGQEDAFRHVLMFAGKFLNIFVLPLSIAVASLASNIVTLAYGDAYGVAALPFAVLSSSVIFVGYLNIMGITLQSTGRTRPLIKIAAISGLVEVVLTATLAPTLKENGPAVARVCMSMVGVALSYVAVRGVWWPTFDRKSLANGFAISLLVAATVFGFDNLFARPWHMNGFTTILIEACLFFFAYLIGLLILRPLAANELELLMASSPKCLRSAFRVARLFVTAQS